jgi:hypothetical protein
MFKGGERVRVPNPNGEGTVEATYVSPSEPSRKRAEYVWVRYVEGQEQGVNAKVRYSEVERA